MARFTSLWRSPWPTRFAPAWAWFASLVVFLSTWNSHGFDSGVRGGLAVYIGWAIVRELAPARPLPSLYAPFAVVAFAIPAETDVLACATVLVAARVAARTVGDPPTWLDCVALVGLASWAATRDVGLAAALVLAAVVFVDGPVRTRIAGALALVAVLAIAVTEGTLTMRFDWDDPVRAEQVLLVIAALAALRLLFTSLPARVRVRDDRRRTWLFGARIRSARIAVVASVLAAIAWTGVDGAFALSSASAAILVVGLGGVKLRARRGPDVAPARTR